MLMASTPTSAINNSKAVSPKAAEDMQPLSVMRPSLSPLKRKMSSIEDSASPTSLDEVPEESVISPKKKVKAEGNSSNSSNSSSKWESMFAANIVSALDLDDLELDLEDERCEQVLAAYVPIAFDATPAGPLAEEELEIINFFLS